MIDPDAALECVDEWLPDFLAWAVNPTHVDAPALFERGRKRVVESFSEHYDETPDVKAEADVAAEVTVVLLAAFAEWVVVREEAS